MIVNMKKRGWWRYTSYVKQEDLVSAMEFVMDNIVVKTVPEFETLEVFSKLYASRRDEMISNRINNQAIINPMFSIKLSGHNLIFHFLLRWWNEVVRYSIKAI